MNKKTKSLLATLLAVIVVGAAGLLVFNASQSQVGNTTAQTQVVEQASTQEVMEVPAVTVSEDQKTVSYDGQAGKTALEILDEGADASTEESSFGEFVTGINGVIADASSEYWAFYVNGEYASEGAGTYETTDGEKIEWKLEAIEL